MTTDEQQRCREHERSDNAALTALQHTLAHSEVRELVCSLYAALEAHEHSASSNKAETARLAAAHARSREEMQRECEHMRQQLQQAQRDVAASHQELQHAQMQRVRVDAQTMCTELMRTSARI